MVHELWEQVRNTRQPESDENRLEDGRLVRSGLFQVLEIGWKAEGIGENGEEYTLAAIEHDPESPMAVLFFGAKPALKFGVTEFLPAQENCSPLLKMYGASLVADVLVGATADVRVVDDERRPIDYLPQGRTLLRAQPNPPTIRGLQQVLEAARFESFELM